MTRSIETWAMMEPLPMPTRRDMNDAIPVNTHARMLEVMHDHATGRYVSRRSGAAFDLGDAALDMISNFFTNLVEDSRMNRSGTNIRNHKEAVHRGLLNSRNYGLSQMADDKVRPLFWAAFTDSDYIGSRLSRDPYTRENAKQKLEAFKEDTGMSNADWKWFCQQDDMYLYEHFRLPMPWCIRWPRHLQKSEMRRDARRLTVDAPLINWLREWCKTDNAHNRREPRTPYWNEDDGAPPSARDFDMLLKDYLDLTSPNNTGQWAEPERLMRGVKTWQQFEEKVRRTEHEMGRGRNCYGRSPAMMAMDVGRATDRMIVNMMRGGNPQQIQRGEGLTFEALQRARQSLYEQDVPEQGSRAHEIINQALQQLAITGTSEIDMGHFVSLYQQEIIRAFQLNPRMFADRVETPQRSLAKPTEVKKFDWLHADVPRTGEAFGGKFKFRLIDDNEKLYHEGTGMEHCIWRLYQGRFETGKYIAYHIDAPHLEKDGFTCGFILKEPKAESFSVYGGGGGGGSAFSIGIARLQEHQVVRVAYDEAVVQASTKPEKKKPDPKAYWAFDQCRGRKNSIPKDKELDLVAKMLLDAITKYQPIPTKENPDVKNKTE